MAKHALYRDLLFLRTGRGRRIGLFGGSFNPVHQGHLQCAQSVKKTLRLDQVCWLPVPSNPLKDRASADFSARMYTLESFLEKHSKHQPSNLYAQSGYTYTLDFLRWLKQKRHAQHIYWIGGADLAAEMHHWKGWRWLPRYIKFCLYNRPGSNVRAAMHPARRKVIKHWVRGRHSYLRSRNIRKEYLS